MLCEIQQRCIRLHHKSQRSSRTINSSYNLFSTDQFYFCICQVTLVFISFQAERTDMHNNHLLSAFLCTPVCFTLWLFDSYCLFVCLILIVCLFVGYFLVSSSIRRSHGRPERGSTTDTPVYLSVPSFLCPCITTHTCKCSMVRRIVD